MHRDASDCHHVGKGRRGDGPSKGDEAGIAGGFRGGGAARSQRGQEQVGCTPLRPGLLERELRFHRLAYATTRATRRGAAPRFHASALWLSHFGARG
jgi:hypothetical protein